MSSKIIKESIDFFTESINKWIRLINLYNKLREQACADISKLDEANQIFAWFQENYPIYMKYSDFKMSLTTSNGKKFKVDPVFNVVFGGSNIQTIIYNEDEYIEDLNKGIAQLRGHLASLKNLKNSNRYVDTSPIKKVQKILTRFHLVVNQLKRRRKNKTPYLIKDEYDTQYLLHALLRLEFEDIRKEDWVHKYAGGSTIIDLVLKNEGIIIEVKYATENLRDKEIGDQLTIDIENYKVYPDAHTLVCFIYDPNNWIENPKGLEYDLKTQSSETLKVEVIVCQK